MIRKRQDDGLKFALADCGILHSLKDKRPKSRIPLSAYSLSTASMAGRTFSFSLQPDSQKRDILWFGCADDDDQTAWIEAIKGVKS